MAGSFDYLLAIDPDVAKKGNEAEAFVSKDPEYSLFLLRAWLEYLLTFLEKYHSAPESSSLAISQAQGKNEFRINRLPALGIKISETELEALHYIRIDSNKAAHAAEHKSFFTPANAERALNRAKVVSNWFCKQYGSSTISNSSSGPDATKGLDRREDDLSDDDWSDGSREDDPEVSAHRAYIDGKPTASDKPSIDIGNSTDSGWVDFLVETIFPNDSRRAAHFASYLEYRGRSALARRKRNEPLSDDEVDYLHSAKKDFSNRLGWADEVVRGLMSLDIDTLMEGDAGFIGFQGMLPPKRTFALLTQYVLQVFLKKPWSELNVLINAHNERMKVFASDEFKSHMNVKDELDKKLAELGEPEYLRTREVFFAESYQQRQKRLAWRRERRRPQTIWHQVGDLFPTAPWSTMARAAKLRKEIDQLSQAPIAQLLSSNLKTFSRVIGSWMAADLEFKRRVNREALVPPEEERWGSFAVPRE